jgi:transcriptional regulator with XRE-family HTH domain
MNTKKIGQKLIELRGKKPRQEAAIDNKISYSALSMYENGDRIPRDEVKIRLANYYGVTVQSIFFDGQ